MPAFVDHPSTLLLPRHAELVFNPHLDDAVSGETAEYSRACTVGEFFEAHPGPHPLARLVLAHALRTSRCQLYCPPPGRGLNGFVDLAEPALGHPVHSRFSPCGIK